MRTFSSQHLLGNHLKLSAKLIIPFTLISVASTFILALMSYNGMHARLTGALDEKARISVMNMAGVLSDPLSMGEFDRLQLIVDSEKQSDPDLVYALVVSPDDAKVIVASDPKMKSRQSADDPYDKEVLTFKTYKKRKGSQPDVFEAVMPIKTGDHTGGVLRLGFSTKHLDAMVSESVWQIAFVGIGALAAGIVIYVLATQLFVIKPIQTIAKKATRIAQGDLVEVEEIKSKDEVGELTGAMNNLIVYFREMSQVANAIADGDLRTSLQPRSETDILGNSFQKMVQSLREIMYKLASDALSLEQAAGQLASASTLQSGLVAKQYAAFDSWLKTLQDIHNIVNEANSTARSVVDISRRSLDESGAGRQALQEATVSMIKIRDKGRELLRNIGELNSNAIQIGRITSLVEEIAQLSEVLTVNATMEAVRAGDAGRPFKVVAKEVRQLSMQSRSATAQVRAVLNAIEQSAEVAFQVMEEETSCVEIGVTQIYQAGSNFDALFGTITNSVEAAKSIAAATETQVTQINEMTDAMSELAKSAAHTTVAARQQDETARELSSLAAGINLIVQQYNV